MNILDWLNGVRNNKPKNLPVYCRECGDLIITRRRGDDFDPQTGKPKRYIVVAYCPSEKCDGSNWRYHCVWRWIEPIEAGENQLEIKE